MFKKILIANRGEIAVRIIRACRELGIRAAVVYAEADRAALHVRLADEAYLLGPSPAADSYLAIEKIIAIAKKSRAEAIHPGYGFLAENWNFAQACEEASIKLIGPSAHAVRLMGSKTEARRRLQTAGIPIVPGTYEPIQSLDDALTTSRHIGLPIMLKAAAGGGGKGMRLVSKEEELPSAFREARSEAEATFGDPSLYIEKCLIKPRHIEIQILADTYGNMIFLGERECSIQRRHQKVIEECPSPIADPSLREKMGTVALRVAKAADYENAGTVEFLVEGGKNFYFLEMNTRLQVEHPITELVTSIDIVKQQIGIASGKRLSLSQSHVKMNGAALECRIYAEDPESNFLPSPGTIRNLREPSGPGIRVDSGVYEGYEVPVFYDPLVAKLSAYGKDRGEAIERMKRSLKEYRILGIKTTIAFFREVLNDPMFLSGDYDTGFLDAYFKRRKKTFKEDLRSIAIIATAIDSLQNGAPIRHNAPQPRARSHWKEAGRVQTISSRL